MDNFSSAALPNSTDCPSIDDFRNWVYSTVYSLITVFSLVGNGFAVFILLCMFRQRSPFQIYMLNLAMSDILCVSALPLRVLYYVNKGQWNYGDFLCRLSSYALYVNLYCSIYFMTVMSVTRFLAVVFPVQNIHWVTGRRTRMVCVVVWIVTCLMCSPFLMSGQHFDQRTNKTKCFEPPKVFTGIKKLVILNYFSFTVGFLVPFLIIVVCYAGIIRALLTRKVANGQATALGKRAIRMNVVVLLTFLLCFMPYHVQRSIHLQFLSRNDASCEEKVAMQKYVVITLCLAATNSCFDPMLYFFSGEGFRNRMQSFRQSLQNKRNERGNLVQEVSVNGLLSLR